MISQITLFTIGFCYLASLFLIAYVTERGLIPKKIVQHPIIFVLSLGVFAGSWAIFGAVGFAHESGYNYLTFYLGISAAYFLSPVLLSPLFRLAKTYQLNSLADIFAFRYRSPFIGKLVTIFMIIAITPILAAQIQSVSSSVQYISGDGTKEQLAIIFCVFITMFTIVFGSQHFDDKNKKHDGLVMAIAFESLFKLVAMLIIAAFCIYFVFDDHNALDTWLRNNPKNVEAMFKPMINGNWSTLMLIFFAASFSMPHMYHMAFTENNNQKSLYVASWGLPLYLLLMAICIPPILWAGKKLFPIDQVSFDYVILGISQATNTPLISLLAYLAGVSAASGIVIVSTLALASMSLNHLIIPRATTPTKGVYLYSWLRWQRHALIIVIITASYLVYRVIDNQQTLSQLILLAYTGSVQFLPALFGVLFWKGANRQGALAGLFVGFGIWFLTFYLPLLVELDPLGFFNAIGIQISYIGIQLNNRNWHFLSMASVMLNFFVMVIISKLTPTRQDEALAAEQCGQGLFSRQRYRQLAIESAHEFKIRLSKPLGEQVAEHEVNIAMKELGILRNENRPFILQKLRNRIETNLSRLLGPSRAQEILSENIPFSGALAEAEDLYSMEGRLEEYQYRLTGLAAELNNLRKFHRQTLIDLPIGVCALAQDDEIVTWNTALEEITKLKTHEVIGASLTKIPHPWGPLFKEFSLSTDTHWHRKKIIINGETRWLNLHKANISHAKTYDVNLGASPASSGIALIVEDMSNILKLEAKLTHSERLASIGRMAAGVAHEIGNPVTGIDCLAQNLLYDIKNTTDKQLPDDGEEMLEEIRIQTKRISSIVQSLMSFSRAGKTDRENIPVNIHHCVEEAKKLLQLGSHERNIKIENECLPSHLVLGDEQLIIQIFINLISNAIDASPTGSSITLRSQPAGSKIFITVIDQGEGIPENILPTVFEPFVTTKDPGKGTGLGLALVHSIIEDHGGSISIENWSRTDTNSQQKISGTQVNIKLPAYLVESNSET